MTYVWMLTPSIIKYKSTAGGDADLGLSECRGDGQTDRKRESSRGYLRTDGQLGQCAAQPLRDCLQLFQLRLLTPTLLAQDLVLQPLVALSKTQHTCSTTAPCSGRQRQRQGEQGVFLNT